MTSAMMSAEIAARRAYVLTVSPSGPRDLSKDEYHDLLLAKVREVELAELREESNRLHSRLLVFTLKVLIFLAALPLLAVIGVFGIVGWALGW